MQTSTQHQPHRKIPLLRAIAREVQERTRAIVDLELRVERIDDKTDSLEELLSMQSELTTHRDELTRVESELTQLGWSLEEFDPLRLLMPGGDGTGHVAWRLEPSGFYLRTIDASA